jgi:predicted nucleic acid-binding protein
MAGRLSVDTSFLIDLQRERRGSHKGAAHLLLEADSEVELFLSAVALGEFAEGFSDPEHPILRAVREQHVILPVDEAVALRYGALTRSLRNQGRLIGSNDLWIAATSLRHDLPLATANVRQFRRIEGLDVVGYR